MHKFKSILGCGLMGIMFAFCASAFAAGASAKYIDVCADGQEGPNPFECSTKYNPLVKQRVVVSVTPDAAHAGRIGAIYLGVRTDGNIRGSFTASGWTGIKGGLFEPVSLFESLPGGTQQYVVFDGGLLCPQIGGGTSELWAGYGVLDDTGEVLVKNYKNYLSKGLTYEHLVLTYVQHDMAENQRAWKVLEVTCQGDNAGGS